MEKIINDIICIVQDQEVPNTNEYIKMEVEAHKEEILKAIIEEIRESL